MVKRLVAVLVLVSAVGCGNAKELEQLKAIQSKLDAELAQKQGMANNLNELRQRHDALAAQVRQRAQADLGADPRATLQRLVPAASRVEPTPGKAGTFELSGPGKATEVLAQLAQLGQHAPGLSLQHLAFLPSGFDARLAIPPAPPPVQPPAAAKPAQAPTLPEAGMFSGSESAQARARIQKTEAELAALDKVIGEVGRLAAETRQSELELRQAGVGDHLPQAVDSGVRLFGGAQPLFTEASADLQGETLTVRGQVPPGPPQVRVVQEAGQHFVVRKHDEQGPLLTLLLERKK